MRYTVYNPELDRWEVPILHKFDGTPSLIVRRDPGEPYTDGLGAVIGYYGGGDYVSGDIIDRLAELENMVEAKKEAKAND